MTEYVARCMKCKKDVPVKDPQVVEMKGRGDSKRRAVKGKCPTCGTTVFRFLGKA